MVGRIYSNLILDQYFRSYGIFSIVIVAPSTGNNINYFCVNFEPLFVLEQDRSGMGEEQEREQDGSGTERERDGSETGAG